MRNHLWKNAGARQYAPEGLGPDAAESYEKCELCGAVVGVQYNAGEGLSGAMQREGVSEDCPKGIEQPVGGTKIFCFVNGGSPGWWDALAVCEDGHVLAGHSCSTPDWAKHDLGIGSDWKHDKYKKHCPNGFELIWVDNPKTHAGLQTACKLNQDSTMQSQEGGGTP